MKFARMAALCVAITLMLSAFGAGQFAWAQESAIQIEVDGAALEFMPTEAPYVNADDRTLVPLRFVSEALALEVRWDGQTGTAFVSDGANTLELNPQDNRILLNGAPYEFDTAIEEKDDRLYVPLRVICESMRFEITYDTAANVASVNTGGRKAAHPNMYLNGAEINAIKKKIIEGASPWSSAYQNLMTKANNIVAADTIYSVVYNGGAKGSVHVFQSDPPYLSDGVRNPLADERDVRELQGAANAVRTLGLAYVFSGEEKYAAKAVDTIRTFCLAKNSYMAPEYGDSQSRVVISMNLHSLFYGADLIYNYPGWERAERDKFLEWTEHMAQSAMEWKGENNFEDWRISVLAAEAALMGKPEYEAYAVELFKSVIPSQIGQQGEMAAETERADAFTYHSAALSGLIFTAEIARHRGINLYDYTCDGRRGLKLAMDFLAPYFLDNASWPYSQNASFAKTSPLYEYAYSFWKTPIYLDVINQGPRPIADVTLTHANHFELDLSQGELAAEKPLEGEVSIPKKELTAYEPFDIEVPIVLEEIPKVEPKLTREGKTIPVMEITASTDDGNIPENAADGDMKTRWSGEAECWILFDLGAVHRVDSVDIAWFKGASRSSIFDLEISADGREWTQVFSGQSSGKTTDMENYDLGGAALRFVRYIGHGNTATDAASVWNSITEIAFFEAE